MLKKIASVLILVIVGLCLLYGCFAFVQKKQLQKAEGLYQIPRTELLNKIIAEKNLHSLLLTDLIFLMRKVSKNGCLIAPIE